ncbi:hypothetical protein [Parendozoicomonas haliclonae]|uniref:Chromosome partition protein Smc n=1 Tax=Parendozoicomonas haliclonae TaxID=1960125 RepID=A0A1X7ALE6_9GAMM|nr:hypothetical protein [Parendozoicomonas haliclonae]SMA47951.1 hypothetical protein EHSB41UT_02611 [Parendozoicomonas haliclonae]
MLRLSVVAASVVAVMLLSPLASARVIMDNTCTLTNDIYVTTLNDAAHVARAQRAMDHLEEIYQLTGNYPTYLSLDLMSRMKKAHSYNFHDKERQTRVAVMVDSFTQNISLMVHSEHRQDDMTWVTDNQAFIDGKTNAYADFRCSGGWIQLKWQGRDLSSRSEYFDSSNGWLSARAEKFLNSHGMDDMRLRVARLQLAYPRNGLAGKISSLYKTYIEGQTPYPHSFDYVANQPGAVPMLMTGKYRPGYQDLDELRVNFDVEKMATMSDESSSQNVLSPNMPVSPATARAALHRIKTLMTRNSSEYMRSLYSNDGLQELIEEADQALEDSMNLSGRDKDSKLKNSAMLLSELSSRSKQIVNLASSTETSQNEMMAMQLQADNLSKQANRMLEHLARKIQEQEHRSEGLRAFQKQQAESDGDLIDEAERNLLAQEPNLFEQEPLPTATKSTNASYPERRKPSAGHLLEGKSPKLPNKDFMEACLMTQNKEGVFGYPVNDRHYGFDIGIEINLLDNHDWLVSLESTRTPWTMPLIHMYGSNYQVPSKDTWCHGPVFGVDHARDNIRLTIRGVYDDVNNSIYTVSMWSIWDKGHVAGHVQGAVTGMVLPGALLVGKLLLPFTGVPGAIAATGMLAGGVLAMTPWAPPETRYPHVEFFTRLMANYGLGELFYIGSSQMTYYGSFSTLKPKGNID